MSKHHLKKKHILVPSALIAVWMLAIADYIVPIPGMYGVDFYSHMKDLPPAPIYYAACMLFTFPLITLGLREILKGIYIRGLIPIMYFFMATVTISMHTSYIYYYHVSRRLAEYPILHQVLKDFDRFKDFMGSMYFAGLALIAISIMMLVLTGKSIYPRWFAVVNPITGILILQILKKLPIVIPKLVILLFIPATTFALMVTLYLLYYEIRGKRALSHQQTTD